MRIIGVLLAATLPAAAGCAATADRQAASVIARRPVMSATTAAAAPAPLAPVPMRESSRDGAFTLPMRVVTNGGGTLVYIPVLVNGQGPYEFVLDTGSSNSSVDRSLVRRLGLPHTGQQHRVQGVTGSGMVPIVRVRRWTLGNEPLQGASLAVVDLGMGVSGLLGSDELRRFDRITLDFQHQEITFRR